jgi:hypothetical protein
MVLAFLSHPYLPIYIHFFLVIMILGLCIPYGSTKSGITLFETINTSNLDNKLTKGFNKQYPNTYSDPEWHTSGIVDSFAT